MKYSDWINNYATNEEKELVNIFNEHNKSLVNGYNGFIWWDKIQSPLEELQYLVFHKGFDKYCSENGITHLTFL